MKRFYNILVSNFLILLCNSLFAQVNPPGTDSLGSFRGIPWGASPGFVRENETSLYLQSFKGFGTYSLSFNGEFADKQVRIDYSFRDDKFIEGAYTLNTVGDIRTDYTDIQTFLAHQFGSPDYWSNSLVGSENIWIKVNDYGKYKGPELYWQFVNGFIVLHASKFKDEITVTIMYVVNKNIPGYGSNKIFIPAQHPLPELPDSNTH